eukprot:4546085-Amphidinium_carterae.1
MSFQSTANRKPVSSADLHGSEALCTMSCCNVAHPCHSSTAHHFLEKSNSNPSEHIRLAA